VSTRRVALTGGIATGKSHVRARIDELGVPTIDSDTLARTAVAPGSVGLAAVTERFGTDVLNADGSLNRAMLGRIVFADPSARRDLEAIVHPQVRRATDAWFSSIDAAEHPFAVADIPLLFEVGREPDFDVVIVTACEPETQVRRVMHRDHLTEDEARQRLAAQLPIADKVARADFVIHTDGTYEETRRQVDTVVAALRQSSHGAGGTSRGE
jgi:dephospho-CoA kinase